MTTFCIDSANDALSIAQKLKARECVKGDEIWFGDHSTFAEVELIAKLLMEGHAPEGLHIKLASHHGTNADAKYESWGMPDDIKKLKKDKFHTRENDTFIEYAVITPSGETATGIITKEELGLGPLERLYVDDGDSLQRVLSITFKRGHTHIGGVEAIALALQSEKCPKELSFTFEGRDNLHHKHLKSIFDILKKRKSPLNLQLDFSVPPPNKFDYPGITLASCLEEIELPVNLKLYLRYYYENFSQLYEVERGTHIGEMRKTLLHWTAVTGCLIDSREMHLPGCFYEPQIIDGYCRRNQLLSQYPEYSQLIKKVSEEYKIYYPPTSEYFKFLKELNGEDGTYYSSANGYNAKLAPTSPSSLQALAASSVVLSRKAIEPNALPRGEGAEERIETVNKIMTELANIAKEDGLEADELQLYQAKLQWVDEEFISERFSEIQQDEMLTANQKEKWKVVENELLEKYKQDNSERARKEIRGQVDSATKTVQDYKAAVTSMRTQFHEFQRLDSLTDDQKKDLNSLRDFLIEKVNQDTSEQTISEIADYVNNTRDILHGYDTSMKKIKDISAGTLTASRQEAVLEFLKEAKSYENKYHKLSLGKQIITKGCMLLGGLIGATVGAVLGFVGGALAFGAGGTAILPGLGTLAGAIGGGSVTGIIGAIKGFGIGTAVAMGVVAVLVGPSVACGVNKGSTHHFFKEEQKICGKLVTDLKKGIKEEQKRPILAH
ncbi:MAG: DUF456 domain-containing protein [Gammaproteobacteria bacterium]|nr:MAG: DUF456 domain-containing protein [Gammaproteobacteria bacterium]